MQESSNLPKMGPDWFLCGRTMLLWVGCLCYIPYIPLGINMPKSVDQRKQTIISSMLSKCAAMRFSLIHIRHLNSPEPSLKAAYRMPLSGITVWLPNSGICMWSSQFPATTNMVQIIALLETDYNPKMNFPFQVSGRWEKTSSVLKRIN